MEVCYDPDYCCEEQQTEHDNALVHFVQVFMLHAAKKDKDEQGMECECLSLSEQVRRCIICSVAILACAPAYSIILQYVTYRKLFLGMEHVFQFSLCTDSVLCNSCADSGLCRCCKVFVYPLSKTGF